MPVEENENLGVLTKRKPILSRPPMFRVLLLNDDYTPMEFVIHVLQLVFGKSREDATQITIEVHKKGIGLCGVYTREVAETKALQTVDLARRNGHPLQCVVDRDGNG